MDAEPATRSKSLSPIGAVCGFLLLYVLSIGPATRLDYYSSCPEWVFRIYRPAESLAELVGADSTLVRYRAEWLDELDADIFILRHTLIPDSTWISTSPDDPTTVSSATRIRVRRK